MLVGEAPGEKEDDEGRPFIGRSGKFLSQILTELGLARDQMFITSAVKCRPPKNRTPRPDELDICRDRWLDSQIDAIQPRVIVLLGGTPVRQLLDETTKLNELHGRVIKKDGRTYLITYHPAAAMRFPRIAAAMRKDLKKVRRLLGNSA